MNTFIERAQQTNHPVLKRLFELMETKQSNLSVAVDVTRQAELLALADAVGPHICVLKTHVDILEDFDQAFIEKLLRLQEKHQFLIFEDRKFADIGNTVKLQFERGIYRIAEWADIINAHGVPGPGIIEGLASVSGKKQHGILMLAQMSSKGSLAEGLYTEQTIQMAEAHPESVIGFIAQEQLSTLPNLITMTPGVNLAAQGDALGQQYRTPEQVIVKDNSDIIIAGRGVIKADDPAVAAAEYQQAGWQAYLSKAK